MGGELYVVNIICNRIQQEGRNKGFGYRKLERTAKKEEVERIKRVFGEEILKEEPMIIWTWDKLSADETPEQYFERHARKIDNLGGKILN